MENIMKIISDMRKSTSCNLTIEKMLEELSKLPKDAVIKIDNSAMEEQYEACKQFGYEFFKMNFTGRFDSYRGYYEDLMIGVSDEPKDFTVGDLTKLLNDALVEGNMLGYKGGDYSINKNTLLWLDDYGHARGIAPIKFYKIDNNNVLLITKYID